MNRFQKVSFKNVGEFLDYIPENERLIVDGLRNLILDSFPGVKEKLSYNVPFYSINKTICYIWPSSIPWGGNIPEGKVALGFPQGHRIPDPFGLLEKGSRKFIRVLFLDEIDPEIIRFYLFEALDLDSNL